MGSNIDTSCDTDVNKITKRLFIRNVSAYFSFYVSREKYAWNKVFEGL